jgi:phage gp29-like protein
MKNGLYVNPTDFQAFAQTTEPLAGSLGGQIATRLAAGDMSSFFGLLPNPDPVLRAMGQNIRVYKNLMSDPSVMGPRRRRIGAIMKMERGFDLEQSKQTPARVLKALTEHMATLNIDRIIRDWIDGAFLGYRVSEMMWGIAEGLPMVVDVIAKPSEWFGFEPEDVALRFRPRGSINGVPVPDRKFVVVGKMRSWENPYGEPDLAACFWPVTFKRGGMKFWMTFTEKYGMPWAVGKLPRQSPQVDTDDLADKLDRMVRDAVAVIPDDASVEFMGVSGSFNADLFERLLMFCRSEISIALLGNNQSVEMQSNKASAIAGQAVEEDLRDDDAAMIADGFNQVVRAICEVNFPGAVPPVYAFWGQEEVDDAQATRDEKLSRAGANFTSAYWERTYDLQPGDLGAPKKTDTRVGVSGTQGDAASFAEPLPAQAADNATAQDLLALDKAVASLPDAALTDAMQKLLEPVLNAISTARTPDEVQAALVQAYPEMDSSGLEDMLTRALFVADLLGRNRAQSERSA